MLVAAVATTSVVVGAEHEGDDERHQANGENRLLQVGENPVRAFLGEALPHRRRRLVHVHLGVDALEQVIDSASRSEVATQPHRRVLAKPRYRVLVELIGDRDMEGAAVRRERHAAKLALQGLGNDGQRRGVGVVLGQVDQREAKVLAEHTQQILFANHPPVCEHLAQAGADAFALCECLGELGRAQQPTCHQQLAEARRRSLLLGRRLEVDRSALASGGRGFHRRRGKDALDRRRNLPARRNRELQLGSGQASGRIVGEVVEGIAGSHGNRPLVEADRDDREFAAHLWREHPRGEGVHLGELGLADTCRIEDDELEVCMRSEPPVKALVRRG